MKFTLMMLPSLAYYTPLSDTLLFYQKKRLFLRLLFSKAMILIRNAFGIASCLSNHFLGFTLEKWTSNSLLPETTCQFSKNHQFKTNRHLYYTLRNASVVLLENSLKSNFYYYTTGGNRRHGIDSKQGCKIPLRDE